MEVVSAFIVSTCQLHPKSYSDVYPQILLSGGLLRFYFSGDHAYKGLRTNRTRLKESLMLYKPTYYFNAG